MVLRRTALSLIGSSVLVAATGCAGSGSTGGSRQKTTFTMAAFPTGNSMDPWKTQLSQYVTAATYDTLTHLDADGTVVPWLATSWDYSDSKTLVMELRTDVVFTDGASFDAETVKANIEYAKSVSPSNVAAAPYLSYIQSVDVVSKSKVRFNLTSPSPTCPTGSPSRPAG